MAEKNMMKRLFNLYLVFLKANDATDKTVLKDEIDVLYAEVIKSDAYSDEEKGGFNEILKQYDIIYESDDMIQVYAAEERIREIMEDEKKL